MFEWQQLCQYLVDCTLNNNMHTTHHCLNIDQVSALFDENKNQVMSRNLDRVITFLKFGVLQPQKDMPCSTSESYCPPTLSLIWRKL